MLKAIVFVTITFKNASCSFHLYICRKHLLQAFIVCQAISGSQCFFLVYPVYYVKFALNLHSSLHCSFICYQTGAALKSPLTLVGISFIVWDRMSFSFHRASSFVSAIKTCCFSLRYGTLFSYDIKYDT